MNNRRLMQLLLNNRRFVQLRWRLSFTLLMLSDQLVSFWLTELYDALEDDPGRAAAIFENLRLQLRPGDRWHPFLMRYQEFLDRQSLSKPTNEVCIQENEEPEEVLYGT